MIDVRLAPQFTVRNLGISTFRRTELVNLVCAIVGVVKSTFIVEIDTRRMVAELKRAIKAQKKNDFKNVDVDKLQLFLTKNSDAWLPDNDNAARVVEVEEFEVLGTKRFTRIGRNPRAAGGSKAKTHTLRPLRDRLNQGGSLLLDLNINKLAIARSVPFTVRDQDPARVAAYKWKRIFDENGKKIMLAQEKQRERYRKYVEDNIRDVLETENLCVVSVEEGQDILSVKVPGYDIELVGRTDLLIMSDAVKEHSHYLWRLPNVKMLIEVNGKLKTNPDASFQAFSELIALDYLASGLVMALLTNLTDKWEFCWISSSKRNKVANIRYMTLTHPDAAFAMIRAILSQSPEPNAEIRLPSVQEPVKRCKLKQVLPRGESSGILEAIEQYRDIESVLGPDIEIACAVGRQIARSIPMLSMYT